MVAVADANDEKRSDDIDGSSAILLAAVEEAARVRREVQEEAGRVRREAQEEAAALIAQARADAERLRAEIARLEAVRNEIREGALAFLLSALELVEGHDGVTSRGSAAAP